MAHGIPERLAGLARERPAGRVGDGARDDDGEVDTEFVKRAARTKERGLGVQRVDHRLDEQQVDSAQHERAGCVAVGRGQIVKTDVAKARIVDIRRQ